MMQHMLTIYTDGTRHPNPRGWRLGHPTHDQ